MKGGQGSGVDGIKVSSLRGGGGGGGSENFASSGHTFTIDPSMLYTFQYKQ